MAYSTPRIRAGHQPDKVSFVIESVAVIFSRDGIHRFLKTFSASLGDNRRKIRFQHTTHNGCRAALAHDFKKRAPHVEFRELAPYRGRDGLADELHSSCFEEAVDGSEEQGCVAYLVEVYRFAPVFSSAYQLVHD